MRGPVADLFTEPDRANLPCVTPQVIRRQEFPFHEALLQKQRARLVEQWRHEVDAEAKIQVPRYQAALKDWGKSLAL